jgi:hypothetical protein
MKSALVIISLLLAASLSFNVCRYSAGEKHGEDEEGFKLWWSDSIFVTKTVEVYDSFVRSRMGDELSIGEAYSHFFAENGAKVEASFGDAIIFMPDSTFVYGWTSELVGNTLPNSLVGLSYMSPRKPRTLPDIPLRPSSWQYDLKYPRFVEFSRQLGKRNSFWTDFADGVEAAGGFSPTCYATLMRGSDNIDFDNREERFITALAFMDGCFDHRDFNLVKDVAYNDSLRTAWDNFYRKNTK